MRYSQFEDRSMRVTRPQFTLGGLMVVVAMTGLLTGVACRIVRSWPQTQGCGPPIFDPIPGEFGPLPFVVPDLPKLK
jgi:hypothetical protein